jgi:hypothetical protein
VKREDPAVVFLMETRLEAKNMNWLRVRLAMKRAFAVVRHGTWGGLALLWANDIEVHIQSFSHSHINAWSTNNVGQRWRLTGFYGQHDASKRHESWSLLHRLRRMSDLPWLVMGDLNEILADNGKSWKTTSKPTVYASVQGCH